MLSRPATTVWINVGGGIAVLGSYAWCMTRYPGDVGDFWGGVPAGLRPVYTLNMFLAAAGYFAFSYFVLFRAAPAAGAAGGVGLRRFNALYALILFPSALWMPLTFAMLEAPSGGLWWAIRLTLAAVGLGSLALLAALVAARPAGGSTSHTLAVVGAAAFSLQTALLDALIWPAYFDV